MTSDQVIGMRFGRFELQPANRQLLIDGLPTAVGARAFDVLLVLCERRDRIVAKSELFDLVWPGLVVEENNLQQQISSLRKLLGAGAIATVPGRGYRFTAIPDLGGTQSVVANPHNLTQPRTRFIGRESVLADCAKLLRAAPLLTLTGIGGCGKTRLAQQLGLQELAAFADGVWFVDLAPLQDVQGVVAAVAAILSVREDAATTLTPRVVAHIAERRMLLVLDNCEHVVDSVSLLIEALLAGCANLRILATSREILGVSGEQVYSVRSLSLPEGADLDAVRQAEAIHVFVDRARLVSPSFVVDAGNAAALAEICRRLDGIPLAIELAAARVKLLSISEILARLNDRFRLLTGGSRALPRHQTLQAAMQWSYELLSADEQRFFRRLAVFASGWSLRAAAQLADSAAAQVADSAAAQVADSAVTQAADSADDYDVLERLTRLHDKSLLLVDRAADAQPRYRMLETVRQYAQERLNEAGDGDEARTRHLLHCVMLAETASSQLSGPRQGEWMARLRLEQEDLLAAHAWCKHCSDGAELGLRLAGALWRYWSSSAQLERGYSIAHEVLAYAGAAANPRARCHVLLGLGQIAFRMGRYEETLHCAKQALTLAREVGDATQIAAGLGLMGNGCSATEQMQQALVYYEEARDIARELGDRFQLANVLNNLAEVHRGQRSLAVAEACYEESLSISREIQNVGITAIVACNLARLLVAAGKRERARVQLLECQAIAEAAGLRGLGEDWLEVSASLAVTLDDYANAALLHGASLARMQEAGAHREAVDDAFIAPLMAHARNKMGALAFDAAEAAGKALDYNASMVVLKAWLEDTRGVADSQ